MSCCLIRQVPLLFDMSLVVFGDFSCEFIINYQDQRVPGKNFFFTKICDFVL